MRPELLIGIDPGTNTGYAEYDPHTKKILLTLQTNFWDTVERIAAMKARGLRFRVFIEDPNGNAVTFSKKYVYGKTDMTREKISQDVGRNKQEARLLIEYFERQGIPYRAFVPDKRKLDATEFRKLTGYLKRISQHERDAARLVYGF